LRKGHFRRGKVLSQGTYEGAGGQEGDEGGGAAATTQSLPAPRVQLGGVNPKPPLRKQPALQQKAGLPDDRAQHASPQPQGQGNPQLVPGLRQGRHR